MVPALLLQGAVSTAEDDHELPRRAGHVSILGVDERFWPIDQAPLGPAFWKSAQADEPGVVLNEALARDLHVAPGAHLTLHLQKASLVPRESQLGRRDADSVVAGLPFTVRAVLPDGVPGSRFNLNPSPAAPRNVFVPLGLLQEQLHLTGRINALLVAGGSTAKLQEDLRRHLTLDDWNLILRDPESRTDSLFRKLDRDGDGILSPAEWKGRVAETFVKAADQNGDGKLTRAEVAAFYQKHRAYLSLESRQFLLEPAVIDAALQAARECHLQTAPTLVYLAYNIAANGQDMPNSLIAALDPEQAPPLGPFLPSGVPHLQDDQIVLAAWPESPLHVSPGDQVTVTYIEPVEGRLPRVTAAFRLAGLLPLHGVADDPDLVPEFPGITDKQDPRSWDVPSEIYDKKRITSRDENYWRQYRTVPRAYITLARGQQLWNSRFGRLTSIRLAPTESTQRLADLADCFRRHLRDALRPEQGGLVFQAVRQRGLQASSGGTDFGVLFLGFSSFLIAAALLLVGLLFRLNLDRRADEVGLWLALGYRARTVRRLLLAEGTILAVLGGVFGTLLALFYAELLLDLLAVLWPGGLERSFLQPHPTLTSLGIGFASTAAICVLTILWAVLSLRRVTPSALLAGETTPPSDLGPGRSPRRWSRWLAAGSAIVGLVLLGLGVFVRDHEMRASTFFGSGALLLIAGLAGVWAWMRGARQGRVHGHGPSALALLGVRNATRQPVRSLLTAGLLASAAFVLVAVESFRQHAEADDLSPTSANGGFTLLAESDLPIYRDLNSDSSRAEITEAMDYYLSNRMQEPPAQVREQLQKYQALLAQVTFQPFRVRAGDDASCLNLYQPTRPRLLGVPETLIQRDGFRFADSLAESEDERHNPWLLLHRSFDDGAIPVIGEANTVTWMLKSGLGQDVEVQNDRGQPVRLRIVALLQNSVFQSGLLMSEANFLKLYPSQEGYNFFLIQTPPGQETEVKALLETALGTRGFEVTPAAQRLEAYLAVENTYLTTFQALGALGLFLGALGLAVVLLRNVWERRGELALLRTLGYRHRALGGLLLAENGFLLLLGLGTGTLAALLAVAPHLLSGEGTVPWPRLLVLLAVVLLTGLLTGFLALTWTLRAPLVPALRRE